MDDADTQKEDCLLGRPLDETEWLKYEGGCIVFAGTRRRFVPNPYYCGGDGPDAAAADVNDTVVPEFVQDGWILESEEATKHRLLTGLNTMGVKCEHVQMNWSDETSGERSCTCIVWYNKPCYVYYSDLFIKLKTSLDDNSQDQPNDRHDYCFSMEFSFSKRIVHT